ncbi:MAG: NUDIX domain-containing protein [Lutibacter sp.]|nr:NUDIX domain-containing protein [Lutibacter sp.]MBP9601106.1 NUDIX domain-containing protein [Lutibacter sp.]
MFLIIMQMYKVFVNDCPIILTENNNISTKLAKATFEDVNVFNLVETFLSQGGSGICLICSDIEKSWVEFKSLFKIQKAAGGKVLNKEDKILFIYRFDKWDLPKGKLDKGESIERCAVREVEEECGVQNLKIIEKLETTYHIFQRKDKIILKITYWFLMKTDFEGVLIPQLEEEIVEVVFKNDVETKKALENTYENIKLLF